MRPATSHGSRCTLITRLALALALLAVGLSGPAVPPARADTLVVTETNNDGAGSLRQAIADAGSGDTITFDPSLSGATITLLSPLSLTTDLTIDGSGLAEPITLSGGGLVRVLEVPSGTSVTLQGLVIADGMADKDGGGVGPGYGGGIYSLGALTVIDCTFSDNTADWAGGAIYTMEVAAVLTVTRCTFTGNSAGSGGGGIFAMPLVSITDSTFVGNSAGESGGAAYVVGTVTVANSTFSGNSASAGGALASYQTLTVENSTFSGNVASGGGGIWFYYGSLTLSHCTFFGNVAHDPVLGGGTVLIGGYSEDDGVLSYTHTIMAGSVNGDCRLEGDASVALNEHNLVEDGSCEADQSGDPQLGSLADNGGLTHTMALLTGSPALNAGDAADCPAATDQRGVARPQGAGCDLGAFEQELPAVTTDPAIDVTATGATLRGTVNAHNSATTVTFAYGLTAGYGTTVTVPSAVTGAADTAVSATLADLAPATTYHYRVVAENGAGAVTGADRTLTTAAVAPTAVTEDATDVTETGATMHGVVNAHNSPTTVTFAYGLDTSYPLSVTVPSLVMGLSDTAVSAVLTDLTPNTTYHYRVVAENAAGTAHGADRTLTTAAAAPSAVTEAATDVTSTGATLHGVVNAQNSATTVTLAYGLTADYGMTATVPSAVTGMLDTAVSAVLSDLTPATTYHYRVVATNGAGTSHGADCTLTTAAAPPTASTGAAMDVTETGATLRGVVNARNGATTVTFAYGVDTSYPMSITVLSPVTGIADVAVSAAVTGLIPGTTYHYRVVAVSAGGTASGVDATFTTLPPQLGDLYLPTIRR